MISPTKRSDDRSNERTNERTNEQTSVCISRPHLAETRGVRVSRFVNNFIISSKINNENRTTNLLPKWELPRRYIK